jgi:hypothetical protein
VPTNFGSYSAWSNGEREGKGNSGPLACVVCSPRVCFFLSPCCLPPPFLSFPSLPLPSYPRRVAEARQDPAAAAGTQGECCACAGDEWSAAGTPPLSPSCCFLPCCPTALLCPLRLPVPLLSEPIRPRDPFLNADTDSQRKTCCSARIKQRRARRIGCTWSSSDGIASQSEAADGSVQLRRRREGNEGMEHAALHTGEQFVCTVRQRNCCDGRRVPQSLPQPLWETAQERDCVHWQSVDSAASAPYWNASRVVLRLI